MFGFLIGRVREPEVEPEVSIVHVSALLPARPPQADDQRLFVDHQFARRNIDCVGSDYTARGPHGTLFSFFL